VQRFAAGRQDVHSRARAQDAFGDSGTCLDQVLAVVKHEQQLAATQKL
jgi:hypothetical protein